MVKTFSLPAAKGGGQELQVTAAAEAAAAAATTGARRGSVQANCKVTRKGQASNAKGKELPYTIEPASTAVDVWALGTMLFLFLTEENLVPVNRNDDLTKAADMKIIAGWDEDARDRRLSASVKDPAGCDLLRKLLDPDKEVGGRSRTGWAPWW